MRSTTPAVNFPPFDQCWLLAPAERSVEFLPVFARVSAAIQSVLREHIPAEYFADVKKFRDLKTAAPMLVYQASPPFRGRKRSELTYDVLNPALTATLFRRARPMLTELLMQVEIRLCAEGLPELADQYAPRRAAAILANVQKLSKSRRYLFLLIRAESVLVDAIVELGGIASLAPKAQARKWAEFGKKWNYQLRRIYPSRDFTHLAPALLAAANGAFKSDVTTVYSTVPQTSGHELLDR